MQRMAMMIRLRPEAAEEYRSLHAAIWPAVLRRLAASGIRNYSVFLRQPENFLVGFWDYHGDDFARDMAEDGGRPRYTTLVDIDPLRARLRSTRLALGNGGRR